MVGRGLPAITAGFQQPIIDLGAMARHAQTALLLVVMTLGFAGLLAISTLNSSPGEARDVTGNQPELAAGRLDDRSAVLESPRQEIGATVADDALHSREEVESQDVVSSSGLADPASAKASLRGLVVGARGYDPIAGAEVLLNSTLKEIPDAVTNDEGRFDLGTTGEFTCVVIRHSGHATRLWFSGSIDELEVDGDRRVFRLEEGLTLSGTIADNYGEPVLKGRIWAYDDNAYNFIRDPQERDPWSDKQFGDTSEWLLETAPVGMIANGQFVIDGLTFGKRVHLLVWSDDVERQFLASMVPSGPEQGAIALTAKRAPSIGGRVVLPAVPDAYKLGVWFCVHKGNLTRGSDRWVPIGSDGAYASGPLWECQNVKVRFEYYVGNGASKRCFAKVVEVPLGADERKILDMDMAECGEVPIGWP
jgi:hypothetical protein